METIIKFKDKILKDLKKHVKDLDTGYYVVKSKNEFGLKEKPKIMIKTPVSLAFMNKHSVGFNTLDYDNFYSDFELIGKINSMEISKIKLKNGK